MKTPLIAAVSGTLISLLATGAQAATYAIDPTHTFVVFEIDHFAITDLEIVPGTPPAPPHAG